MKMKGGRADRKYNITVTIVHILRYTIREDGGREDGEREDKGKEDKGKEDKGKEDERKGEIRMKVVMESGRKRGRWMRAALLGLAVVLIVKHFRGAGRRQEKKAGRGEEPEEVYPAYGFRFRKGR